MNAIERAAAEKERERIVALLKELRDELTGEGEWSVKRGIWNMAILAAEGKINPTRRRDT